MFSDQQYYEAKVFLRSYKDALDCLKQFIYVRESAQKHAYQQKYERMTERIIDAKQESAVISFNQINEVNNDFSKRKNFINSYEVKLFQFSKYFIQISLTFKKYLPEFQSFSGEYKELSAMLKNACDKMEKDLGL